MGYTADETHGQVNSRQAGPNVASPLPVDPVDIALEEVQYQKADIFSDLPP